MTKLTEKEIEARVNQVVEEVKRDFRYKGYLQSPAWKSKRKRKLLVENYTCEHCGYCSFDFHIVEIPLDVHHKTYKNLGNEPMSDLVVLCRNCHEKLHGRKFTQDKIHIQKGV